MEKTKKAKVWLTAQLWRRIRTPSGGIKKLQAETMRGDAC